MHKKITKILFIFILVISLSGCHVPVLNKDIRIPFFEKTDEEILSLMIEKMKNLKKVEYDFDLQADISVNISDLFGVMGMKPVSDEQLLSFLNIERPRVLGMDNFSESEELIPVNASNEGGVLPIGGVNFLQNEEINFTYNIQTTGKTDVSDKDNVREEANIDLNIGMDGLNFDIGLDTILVGDVLYLRLSQLPFPYSMFIGDEYTNIWWELDFNALLEKEKELVSILGEENQFDDLSSILEDKVTKNIEDQIETLLLDKKSLIVEERLEDEVLNEKECYHFKLKLNKEILKSIFNTVAQTVEDEVISKNDQYQSLDIDISDFYDQIIDNLTIKDLDIFIEKESFYLQRVAFTFDFNLDNLDLGVINVPAGVFKSEFEGNIDYSNFEGNIEIKKPEDSKSVVQFIEDNVLPGLMDARRKSRDAKRIADVKQLQTALEMYFTENDRYPENLDDLSPAFMYEIPESPEYEKVNCASSSEYQYTAKLEGMSYGIEYCLEGDTSIVKSGLNIATEVGINAGNPENLLKQDSDGDLLIDYEEINIYKTDKDNPDTDGDGVLDGEEIRVWSNPLGEGDLGNYSDTPQGIVIDSHIKLHEGNNSYRKYEYYSDTYADLLLNDFGLTIEEFNEVMDSVWDLMILKGGINKVDFINFTKIKEEENWLKFEYDIKLDADRTTREDDNFSYLIKIDGKWMVDIERELLYTKEEKLADYNIFKLQFSKENLQVIQQKKNNDTDEDGLSDYEEEYIYGTSSRMKDTDGDGFLDGEEVKGGYNPKGEGKLR